MMKLLLYGPEAIGRTKADVPTAEELQGLWRDHAAELKAALPKGRKSWAAEKLWLIAITTCTPIPPGC